MKLFAAYLMLLHYLKPNEIDITYQILAALYDMHNICHSFTRVYKILLLQYYIFAIIMRSEFSIIVCIFKFN